MFRFFEKLLHPYPPPEPRLPPHGLFAFLWACTYGLRGMIATMALLVAVVSAFEALLFAVLGRIVDWLGGQAPARLWEDRGTTLTWLGIAMLASVGVVALQTAESLEAALARADAALYRAKAAGRNRVVSE